jgi:hypothetical protein
MYWSHSVNKNKLLKIWKYKEWSLKYMMFKFRSVNEYLISHLYSIKIKFCLIILSLLHQWKNQWTQNKKDSRKSISTERRKEESSEMQTNVVLSGFTQVQSGDCCLKTFGALFSCSLSNILTDFLTLVMCGFQELLWENLFMKMYWKIYTFWMFHNDFLFSFILYVSINDMCMSLKD